MDIHVLECRSPMLPTCHRIKVFEPEPYAKIKTVFEFPQWEDEWRCFKTIYGFHQDYCMSEKKCVLVVSGSFHTKKKIKKILNESNGHECNVCPWEESPMRRWAEVSQGHIWFPSRVLYVEKGVGSKWVIRVTQTEEEPREKQGQASRLPGCVHGRSLVSRFCNNRMTW